MREGKEKAMRLVFYGVYRFGSRDRELREIGRSRGRVYICLVL